MTILSRRPGRGGWWTVPLAGAFGLALYLAAAGVRDGAPGPPSSPRPPAGTSRAQGATQPSPIDASSGRWRVADGADRPVAGARDGVSPPGAALDPAVTALLADTEPAIRRLGVRRLAEQHDEEARPHLFHALHDPAPEVRLEALAGLSRYGDTALEPLTALLTGEPDIDVRAEAVRLLGQLGGVRVVETVRAVARDADPRVRLAAVDALGHAGPRAVAGLDALARDPDEGVRQAVLRTLALYAGDRPARELVHHYGATDPSAAVQHTAGGLLETADEEGSAP